MVSSDQGAEPDLVMACAGDVPTKEALAAVERRHLGIDHILLGKRLAESWSLPREIVEKYAVGVTGAGISQGIGGKSHTGTLKDGWGPGRGLGYSYGTSAGYGGRGSGSSAWWVMARATTRSRLFGPRLSTGCQSPS